MSQVGTVPLAIVNDRAKWRVEPARFAASAAAAVERETACRLPTVHRMALREFTDERGRRWRAWDIVPDQLHPTTRLEDYMQGFLDGWLAFETVDGAERARLTPVPVRWAEGSDEELRDLLARAERGQRHRASQASPAEEATDAPSPMPSEASAAGAEREVAWSGDSWPALPAERRPSAPAGTIRTFRYPGGRFWSVYEQTVGLPVPGSPGVTRERVVLRFSSGRRSLDLLAWPAAWFRHSEEELAELLWRAFPREASSSATATFRRRRSDQPAPA